MKKHIVFSIIMLLILFGLTACGNIEQRQKQEQKVKTAEDIVIELKEKGLSIGKYVIYTEETDPNNLLGRPNQYTSKIIFEDTRLEQANANNEFLTDEERNEPTGGTVEVFNSEEDMKKRKEYIETVSSSMSVFAEYSYSKGCALLRLDKNLTPSQAKEYEDAFYNVLEN